MTDEPNLRAVQGGNMPTVADLLVIHYEPSALELRNRLLINDVGALETKAAALAAIETDEHNTAAAALVREIRALDTRVTACKEMEKRPLLTASANVEGFIKSVNDATSQTSIAGHKKRLERLVGAFAQKKADDERKRRDEEAAELQRLADAKLAAAQTAADAGSAKAAEILLGQAVKTDNLAATHAGATVHELARSHSEAGTTGLRTEWSEEIVNVADLKATLGPLRDCFTVDVMNVAIRKFRIAEVAAGRDPVLPGVKFTKGFTGAIR